ncbi:hypothetical protein J6590_005382 [Homalodisca vitripennis]|nr:hypothetical protein J6590_005382 [Homalodisca vitripennis]
MKMKNSTVDKRKERQQRDLGKEKWFSWKDQTEMFVVGAERAARQQMARERIWKDQLWINKDEKRPLCHGCHPFSSRE